VWYGGMVWWCGIVRFKNYHKVMVTYGEVGEVWYVGHRLVGYGGVVWWCGMVWFKNYHMVMVTYGEVGEVWYVGHRLVGYGGVVWWCGMVWLVRFKNYYQVMVTYGEMCWTMMLESWTILNKRQIWHGSPQLYLLVQNSGHS